MVNKAEKVLKDVGYMEEKEAKKSKKKDISKGNSPIPPLCTPRLKGKKDLKDLKDLKDNNLKDLKDLKDLITYKSVDDIEGFQEYFKNVGDKELVIWSLYNTPSSSSDLDKKFNYSINRTQKIIDKSKDLFELDSIKKIEGKKSNGQKSMPSLSVGKTDRLFCVFRLMLLFASK